jgi:2-amino-4-hydroxy-6-hydroxymethyldihydropteridine diphosphokinase
MSVAAYVALGSNVGDRRAHLDAAVAALAEPPGVTLRGVSSYHETAPVGGPSGQGAFLNAAAAVETTLDPMSLLQVLHSIEAGRGRTRTVAWGERTLDLDLILFGDEVVRTTALRVPHPRFALRRFVLAPLAEIAPAAVDPSTKRTVAGLLANLDRRPSYVALVGLRPQINSQEVFRGLVAALSAEGLSYWAGAPDLMPGSDAKPVDVFDRALDKWAHELRADRWTPAAWEDRWIVTDFWFDKIALQARSWLESDPTQWGAFHARFLSVRERVIQPTFIVPSGLDLAYLGMWAEQRRPPDDPIGTGTPTLLSGQRDPATKIDDIVTACAGTRP